MCAEYDLKTNMSELTAAISAEVYNKTGETRWDEKFRLTTNPLVFDADKSGEKLILSRALFPQKPFPNSRLSDLVTDKKNDHVEVKRIYERPTWAEGFSKAHCIVPMTSFNESAYWGSSIGHSMEFSMPGEVLFAVAIRIKPQTPRGEKFSGISLLTHVATEQMSEYHQRLVVFLKAKNAVKWLNGPFDNVRENFDWLVENRYQPTFEVVAARKMASGWKKRVGEHEAKRQDEKEYESFLRQENILG